MIADQCPEIEYDETGGADQAKADAERRLLRVEKFIRGADQDEEPRQPDEAPGTAPATIHG